VEERHEIGVVKTGTTRKAALKTVFVYVYQERIILKYILNTRIGGCEMYAYGSRYGKVEGHCEHGTS
jgi:hypothetical protein